MISTELPKPPVIEADISAERQLELQYRYIVELHDKLSTILESMAEQMLVKGQPVPIPRRTVADLLANAQGARGLNLAYAEDEAGGAVPVFSDETTWRRTTDRAVVS